MMTCIDGDPDRPIITGAVPNPTTPTTVSGKNGMRNVIRTGGGTELNLHRPPSSGMAHGIRRVISPIDIQRRATMRVWSSKALTPTSTASR
jgi:hypothetical protein